MGLGPRSAHKARRQFSGAGRRGRAARGSGRPPPGRDGCPQLPAAARAEQAPEALPHLSPEALGYFRRALSALKVAPDAAEERELMARNILKEVEAQALALATNRTGSEMLQELLGFSPLKPLCRVWIALRPNLRFVACHRCGVHVLQSALLQLPRLLRSPAEADEEEEGEDGPSQTLEELVLGLAAEVCDDFLFFCGDTHGSFVVRTLLQVLGGTLLESERVKPRGSQSSETQRTSARECKPTDFEVPKTFLNRLQDLSACFLKDIAVFITDKISSFCLQVALQVLHHKLPQHCAHLCDAVIDYLSSRNSSAGGSPLLLFLRDQTSSRLLEQVLLVLEPERLQRLFKNHFQGQLYSLAEHPIANFPLQRLLDAVTSPELLSLVFEELSPALEAVLARGHPGVVVALVEACRRVGAHQAQVLQLLFEAFHCAEPPSRQVACVPLFASLLAYEVYYELMEEEGAVPAEHQVEMASARPLREVTVLGSLLLQHLLYFSNPGLVLRSLSALTGPQLLTLAQSPAGSHVFDAILTSPSVTHKQRRRVLKTLKGQYVALACSRHGSRVFDAIWSGAALGARKEIAAELGEQNQELIQDPFGHHVARNVALTTFLKRRQAWEQQQNSVAKRRRALNSILGD
ncbi:similar to chromosome 14 open reading frame 21 (predicted) [Rattus norvegicus]|uniref:NOP9 nucleolar protein n=2 Tax=Rattus norvegicus TaxID=10116 RepID=D3ZKI9_RAT|nr:nucleolar protein 9 [Rattus norvegicus]EDM14277.1 similar to chromosome 14 open reading frame 21 (predicted) [Rattus norvegicus]|eukprot:NP_001099510.1 nucleolar protein 9 [Rattus norvegicus]